MAFERKLAASMTLALGVLFSAGPRLMAQGTDSFTSETAIQEGTPSKTEVVRERYTTQAVKLERSITQDSNLNFVNHGPWTMWDPAGNLIAKGDYRFGKRNGLWKRWFIGSGGVKSGDPTKGEELADAFNGSDYAGFTRPFTSEAKFADDKLNGAWSVTDADGKAIFTVELDHNTLNGRAVNWYPNGQKQREITLKSGVVDGEWKEWDAQGNLTRNDHYIDGSRLAEATLTFDSGEKSAEGVYLYAKDVVKAELDWWTGKVSINATPSDGKQAKQGKWTYWYQTGEKRCDSEYLDDKPVGQHTWWYRNGQKECEGRYADGLASGTWTFWHENGLQAAQGDYTHGNRMGRWLRWNADGKVVENIDHGTGTNRTVYGQPFNRTTTIMPPAAAPVANTPPAPTETVTPIQPVPLQPRTVRMMQPSRR